MFTTISVSLTDRVAPTTARRIARFGAVTLGAVGALATTSLNVAAQDAPEHKPRWEFIVPSGVVVPTGPQADAVKRAMLSAVQLSYVPRPAVAITATVGWARSRDIAAADEPKLDIFMYDLGAEVRAPRVGDASGVTFSPFASFGAGARSYDYRSLRVDATHNVSAYAGGGGEIGLGRVGVRLEVRDYLSGFKPLNGVGSSNTGNDVVLLAGLRIGSR